MDISTLRIVAFAAACATAFPAQALQSCRAASGPQALPLVELYTSEGCDSCPPADRWLAKQFPAAATDARAVALAFHVDYWDRLGWADRFASPAYTERQYASMRANAATFVYTPQVLLQGHDLRGWADAGAAVQRAARATARASIMLDAAPSGNAVAVTVDAAITDAARAAMCNSLSRMPTAGCNRTSDRARRRTHVRLQPAVGIRDKELHIAARRGIGDRGVDGYGDRIAARRRVERDRSTRGRPCGALDRSAASAQPRKSWPCNSTCGV